MVNVTAGIRPPRVSFFIDHRPSRIPADVVGSDAREAASSNILAAAHPFSPLAVTVLPGEYRAIVSRYCAIDALLAWNHGVSGSASTVPSRLGSLRMRSMVTVVANENTGWKSTRAHDDATRPTLLVSMAISRTWALAFFALRHSLVKSGCASDARPWDTTRKPRLGAICGQMRFASVQNCASSHVSVATLVLPLGTT